MRYGEVWVARGLSYLNKPRPVVVVQSDAFEGYESTVVCLLTTSDSSDKPSRVKVPASSGNGLTADSWVMTEKMYSTKPDELQVPIGRLTDAQMAEVSEQLRRVLGL